MQTGADGSAIVQSNVVSTGLYAAQLSETSTSGSKAGVRESLAASQTDLTVSGDFQITVEGASGGNVPIFRLFDSSGTRLMSLYRQNQDSDHIWVGVGSNHYSTTGDLPLNTWEHIDLHVITAGTGTSTIEAWVNGTMIYQTNTASLGSSGVLTLQIGTDTAAQTFTLFADNITATH